MWNRPIDLGRRRSLGPGSHPTRPQPRADGPWRPAPQADGSVRPEPRIEVADVARAVGYMASLPLDANVATLTVLATKMPYIGRG